MGRVFVLKNVSIRLSLIVIIIFSAFFSLSYKTLADPTIKPEIHSIFMHNWNKYQKQFLMDLINDRLTANDTYGLYNLQVYTANLLYYAVETQDVELLNDLAEVYLEAYDYLTTETQYVYSYWPGDTTKSIHDLETSAKMWLGEPITIGEESLGEEVHLCSSQFIYALAKLCNAITSIDSNSRTTTMNTFLTYYVPVILTDHYDRWIFSSVGEFQVKSWGGPSGLYNHNDFLQAKYDGDFLPKVKSYVDIVTDKDMWIVAGVVEMLAANENDSTAVPITTQKKQDLLDYVDLASDLMAARMTDSSLQNYSTASVTGANFELGYWDDHPDFEYAGYTGSDPESLGYTVPASNVGWDVSHARRFVHVFNTLHHNRSITGQTFPDTTMMQKLTNQFIYGAFNKDFDSPLTTNYMDGTNGWFRVNWDEPFSPYGMCSSAATGGFMFWSEYNSDTTLMCDAIWDLIKSLYTADVSGHFRGNVVTSEFVPYGDGNPNSTSRYVTFDGSGDDYLNWGADNDYAATNGSIELWYKPDDSEVQDLIYMRETNYEDYLLIRRLSDNRIWVLIEDGNSTILSIYTTATITTGKWNHIAITQNGTSAKIYINGAESTLTGTNSNAWTDHLTLESLRVGASVWSHPCNGSIDDIRIYGNALSATEVTADYQSPHIIAEWTFDNANDQYLVFNAATTSSGKVGDGLELDGSDDYFRAYPSSDMSSAVGSIQLWFKPIDASTVDDLVHIKEDSYYNYLLLRRNSDDTIKLLIEDDDSVVLNVQTTATITVGEWNHVAVTQDGSGAKIYINGIESTLTGTNSGYWTDHLSISSVIIGASAWNNYLAGTMDEIQFVRGVLSSGEIAAHYTNGSMVECWTFNSSEEEYLLFRTDITEDGIIGKGVSFDGSDNYFRADPNQNIASDTGSVELWFKPDESSTIDDLINIKEDSYYNYLLLRRNSDDTVRLLIEDDNNIVLNVQTTATITVGEWNHVAVTQDGSGAKIYINGIESTLTGTNSSYWTGHLSIAAVFIGTSSWNYYFAGTMDELHIYDYARSGVQISQEYRRPGMLGRWEFDEQRDMDQVDFASEYYGTDYNMTDSRNILMFLPSFMEL